MRFPILCLGLTALLLAAGCNSDRNESDVQVSETVEPDDTAAPAGTGLETTVDPGDRSPGGLLMPDEDLTAPPAETPAETEPPAADPAAANPQPAPATDADQAAAAPQGTPSAAAPPDPLVIGSKAPPLDIEHWVQMGQEGAEPVTQFEKDKVYVVEFWATWCGPCISSMPHLAETQQEYGDRLRIVSVSTEPLSTVKSFLERPAPTEEDPDRTFAQLTSVYSLTTDPDQSVYDSYMRAAGQTGIPAAFIVGKSGHVEWIGHPMEMDEPLAAVVGGSWDREAYAKAFLAQQQVEETVQKAFGLARQGKTEEALAELNKALKQTEQPKAQRELKQYKLQLLVAMGDRQQEVSELGKEMLKQASGEEQAISSVAWLIYQAANQGGVPDELVQQTISTAEIAVKDMERDERADLLDTVAHLHEVSGNLDAAIAVQEEAVEAAGSRLRERLKTYLDELKKAKAAKQETAKEEDAKPADADKPAEDADQAKADEAEKKADAAPAAESDDAESAAPAESAVQEVEPESDAEENANP